MALKLTIEDMRAIAAQKGGKCLSEIYKNNVTHLEWECAKGHQWIAVPMSIRKGVWCPACATESRKINQLDKSGLERCNTAAKIKGGRCISITYRGNNRPLQFECKNAHQWFAAPSNIFAGKWCPYCSGNKIANPLQDLIDLAKSKGGIFRSNSYKTGRTKYLWECSDKHQWKATGSNVKRGSWCPTCVGFKTLDQWYDLMLVVASQKQGSILTPRENFSNSRATQILLVCSVGHQWKSSCYNVVNEKHWCKRCKLIVVQEKKRITIQEMQSLAVEKGGKCISENYKGAHSRLEWECSEGHQWKAAPTSIKSGTWCSMCAKENLSKKFRKKDAIVWCRQLAENKGGRLISTHEPRNSMENLIWECSNGHQWSATPNNVRKGRWCPTCSSGTGERICRIFFEALWDRSFPSSWPDWLKRDGHRRQLDGYNECLQIAFEHQGRQHYEQLNGSKFNRVPIQQQIEEDEHKLKICKEHGVTLFRIPEIPNITPIDKVKEVIRAQCEEKNIPLPVNFETKKVDLRGAWDHNLMAKLHQVAKERGGRCISGEYIGLSEYYTWECGRGHSWTATGASIVHRKSWCRKCSAIASSERIKNGFYTPPRRKLDLTVFQKMKDVAIQKGGRLLDSVYVGVCKKYNWECKNHHTWKATGSNVTRGSWCPTCVGFKTLN